MGFLCIDIGATNTLLGIGNGDFEVVERIKTRDFLQDINGTVKQVLEDSKIDISDVAVAAAGPIDREKGEFYPPNIDEMDKVQIREPLEQLGDFQVVNDCTSAVLGEFFYGGHGVENLIYVTISSGIGAGAVIDGNPVEGINGNLGEVGHMKLDGNGLECGCGGSGHWEAYCSGNSLPRLAEHLTGKEFEDGVELFEAYYSGDSAAEKTVRHMQEYNSKAFSNLVNLFNPEKIVLGGAVALNHPEEVVEPLEKSIEVDTVNQIPEIELCSLGEKSVIHGLRAICNEEV